MSDPLADTARMLDGWERDAAEKAARFQALNERVAGVSITESVAGGAVSATVGNNGLPTNIAMTERVRQMSPDEIAGHVMAAIRKAQSRYPQVLSELVAETVGTDPAGQFILDSAYANFPAPVDEETPSGPRSHIGELPDEVDTPPPPRRRATRDSNNDSSGDEDFGDSSILRRGD
ncbi:YbaB/EbfC family nucleoid-associated protein [Actinokineospora diospyrosa]|uniref:YbaB/EbfC DNA-binding family protein n=1 Tax=Actinokineospora diospyrosa TaxID=103728 RepID=A0ABT1IC69_9PSEU|nr:YbaB/EbfC family nucleoid-associated protein [Actinokineospora diospyrosa]MCP2270225.1 YbaB/EbfC DNA-binding family protein [Actinokineospora diospyrosa]